MGYLTSVDNEEVAVGQTWCWGTLADALVGNCLWTILDQPKFDFFNGQHVAYSFALSLNRGERVAVHNLPRRWDAERFDREPARIHWRRIA